MPAAPCRVLIVALLAGALVACGPEPSAPPDVVLIAVESLRADHLSHLGYERPTAAGLDAFRRDATLFSHATAPTSACVAASASLLTGLSPIRHGANGEGARLGDGVETLAGRLAAHGWRTVGVSHHAGTGPEAGFDRGFERFDAAHGAPADHPDAAQMVAWLREWLSGEREGPTFLYLHLMNPHGPYRVPPAERAALLGHPPPPGFRYGAEPMRSVMHGRTRRARTAVGTPVLRSLVDQYDTAVHYTLARVGDLLGMLRRAGVYDDALVVVAGTHGEELFDDGGFGHGYTLRHEVLHVPLYLKPPRARPGPAPRRVDAPVSTTDVVATVLELLGLPPAASDGRSLAPLLGAGAEAPPRDFLYWLDEPQRDSVQSALMSGRHKLVAVRERYDGVRRRRLLYDHVLDPREERNLADEAPEIARDLEARLRRAVAIQKARPAAP